MKTIFIAYNHKDKIIARFVYYTLIENKWEDVEVFMDEFSILPSENIKEKCIEYAKTADLGIIIHSDNTIKSEYVPQEIGMLLFRPIPKIYIALHPDFHIPPGYENSTKSFEFYNWINPNDGLFELNNLIRTFIKPKENNLSAEDLNTIAITYSKKGEYLKALEYYKKSIENDPLYDNARSNIIRNYSKMGRYEDALKAANEALKILPDNCKILKKKASVLYNLDKFEEAKDIYKKVVDFTIGKDQHAMFYYGKCLLKLNKLEEAKKCFEEAFNIDPSSNIGENALNEKVLLKKHKNYIDDY